MLKVNNVFKEYTRKEKDSKILKTFYAVNDVTININQGEIVGLLGPNGAGKTTLLRMVSGMIQPTQGSVEFNNLNYNNNEIEIKKKIGFLSNNTKLYNNFSAREILKFFGQLYNMSKRDIENRIIELTNALDLEEFLDNKINNLSTGQSQRLNIARVIMHNPELYILDEPTLGLDIISSEAIINFIKTQKDNNKGIVYSTHYMEEAQFLCDRVYMINKGKIIVEGKVNELLEEYNVKTLRDLFFTLNQDGEKDEN